MKKVLRKIKHHYRDIPNKKPYLEFVTAILSIPVLLTVIILNFNSLRGDKAKTATTPINTTQKIYVTVPAGEDNTNNSSSEPCTPGIGNVSITSPEEGELIQDNPVYVSISYKKNGFCQNIPTEVESYRWLARHPVLFKMRRLFNALAEGMTCDESQFTLWRDKTE